MKIGKKVKRTRNPKRIVQPIPIEIPQEEPKGIPVEIPMPAEVPLGKPNGINSAG